MAKRHMKAKTRDMLIYMVSGVITATVLVFTIFGVKRCNDNADEKAILKNKAKVAESLLADANVHADSVDLKNRTLVIENDSLRKDLATANDSIVVLNDSIDVLNAKNTKLKHDKDSIVAELDDCKASKQVVKKPAVATAKKSSTQQSSVVSQQPAKVEVVKPMPQVVKPCEPVIIEQKPQNNSQGTTTVNVNTPGNTINISNGGIINNFYGDCEKRDVQKEAEEYRNVVYISAKKVRCK